MNTIAITSTAPAPAPVAFGRNVATARYIFIGTLSVDLLAPTTSGPNDEWAIPAQHIFIPDLEAAASLRDFLTAAIEHAKARRIGS